MSSYAQSIFIYGHIRLGYDVDWLGGHSTNYAAPEVSLWGS